MESTRRDFVRLSGGVMMAGLLPVKLPGGTVAPNNSNLIFLEAEQFADTGGWDTDQQSMDQMGSPYLLAHGLGVPVKDVVTTVKVAAPGKYRVWVRTRDWVAPWKAPGAPGKFQVLVSGRALPVTFGTEGAEWHWQDGGIVELTPETTVALHDLTGFEGRCDALLFSKDVDFRPPNERTELARFRRAALGLPEEPKDGGTFDLVVVGGGIAGASAALSAARNGLTVALVQDRPVLGGNGSSEVRVWPEGRTNQRPYPHVGDIVEELVPRKGPGHGNAKGAAVYADGRKLNLVRAEPRIRLFTDHHVFEVDAQDGQIQSVVAQHTHTGVRVRLTAKFFADCTGDATVGFLAGADYEVTREKHQGLSNLWSVMDVADPKQVLQCECKDKTALAMAAECGNVAAPFPRCPWAIDLADKPFPGRTSYKGQWGTRNPLDNLGGWFWESGFDQDPIHDVERIRDLNLRAMYGAWDALKNVDKLYPNHRIGWAAFIAGKRESRRLLGDIVLTALDFKTGRVFPDPAFPCSWPIDLHGADSRYQKGLEGQEFIAQATSGKSYQYHGPYWAPYRCLYSRNITNLFMAGRDISVTHEGLGPVRVMRTCGMMGEIVGKAAWICVSHETTPRGVYEKYLPLLQQLMKQPGASRRETLHGALVE
ncbi:MAG: FAD-dependent oxidoreductase [Isosphaeraceae bacterium]